MDPAATAVAGAGRSDAWAARAGPLLMLAACALLAGAVIADARLAALDRGVLPAMTGRGIAARAVLLEPVRQRRGGPPPGRRSAGRCAWGRWGCPWVPGALTKKTTVISSAA